MHSALHISLLAFLGIFLSLRVIYLRRKYGIYEDLKTQAREHLDLHRAVRAFGNYTEYAALGIVLLLALEMAQAAPFALHVAGGALFIGRATHALGLSSQSERSTGRTIGITLSLLSWLWSAGALLWYTSRPVG